MKLYRSDNIELYEAIDTAFNFSRAAESQREYYDTYLPALFKIDHFVANRADQITLDITGEISWNNGVEELVRKGIRQGYTWSQAEISEVQHG